MLYYMLPFGKLAIRLIRPVADSTTLRNDKAPLDRLTMSHIKFSYTHTHTAVVAVTI